MELQDQAQAGLEGILAPIQAELDELNEKRSGLLAEVAALDDERNRLTRVLRAAFPERFLKSNVKNPTRTSPVKRPNATGAGISVELADKLEEWVREWLKNNDSVTQTDCRLALGWDQSRASAGFKALRERNVLRQAGQKGSTKFYRLTTSAMEEE